MRWPLELERGSLASAVPPDQYPCSLPERHHQVHREAEAALHLVLDLGSGFGSALLNGGLERGVVAFVLVGVGFGEVGDGLVELIGAAEVGGQRDAVP